MSEVPATIERCREASRYRPAELRCEQGKRILRKSLRTQGVETQLPLASEVWLLVSRAQSRPPDLGHERAGFGLYMRKLSLVTTQIISERSGEEIPTLHL